MRLPRHELVIAPPGEPGRLVAMSGSAHYVYYADCWIDILDAAEEVEAEEIDA